MSKPEKPQNKAAKMRPDGMPVGKPFGPNNKGGRPKGSRHKLGEEFIKAMHDDWCEHGSQVIETVRLNKPEQYLKVVASILPKDINLNVNEYEDATTDELVEQIRQLDTIIRPFLDAGTASEAGEGTGKKARPTAH